MMLAEKVYNLSSFNRQYEALLILSVCETIPNLVWDRDKSDLLSQIDWNNMLSIASLFSYCNESKYLDAALRIAQTCLVQEETNENQKNAAAFILDNLFFIPFIFTVVSSCSLYLTSLISNSIIKILFSKIVFKFNSNLLLFLVSI